MSKPKPIPELTEADPKRFWSKVDVCEPDDCWEWIAGRYKAGYGQFWLNGKGYIAHRVAYFIEHGKDPGEMLVCHTCDNPPCCNPAHLWLGTNNDNTQDKIVKGRQDNTRGEKCHSAKLTKQNVREIRASDKSDDELAKWYGVHLWTVTRARLGLSWKHVK